MTALALAHLFPALLAQAQMFTPPTGSEYMRILPELVLTVFGMIVMVVDPLLDEERSQKTLGTIALTGALAALASTLVMAQNPGAAFWNMVRVESFSIFFHVLILAISAVVILSSYEYMAVQRIRAGEYYGLILFGTVGMCLMSSSKPIDAIRRERPRMTQSHVESVRAASSRPTAVPPRTIPTPPPCGVGCA